MSTVVQTEVKYNILIIHGVEGYPEKNWYPWLVSELEALGHKVVVPQFPTKLPPEGIEFLKLKPEESLPDMYSSYDYQTLQNWWVTAEEFMKDWDPERTIIVGHSLGGIATLQFSALFARMKQNSCCATIAVCPVGGDIEELSECGDGIKTFYKDIDGEAIRKSAGKIVVVTSDYDEIVPCEQAHMLADRCGTDETIIIQGGGHLYHGNGYTALPQLRDVIINIMNEGKPGVFPGPVQKEIKNPKVSLS